MGRRRRTKTRVEVWSAILIFRIGDRVRHKRGLFEHGTITSIDHLPIYRDGTFRLDGSAFEAWVKVEDDWGESVYNLNELEFDPLYQLAKESDDAA